jgi:hypothetical protein
MLIERRVDFANGYRMRCHSCRASTWLTAEDYALSRVRLGEGLVIEPGWRDENSAEDAAITGSLGT